MQIVKLTLVLFFWFYGLSIPLLAHAQQNIEKEIQALYQEMPKLDDEFQTLSNDFYTKFLRSHSISEWAKLESVPAASSDLTEKQWVLKIAETRKNLEVLCANILSPKFFVVVSALYQANETATLQKVSNCIKAKGDPVARSENYFQLAQYYYQRNQWEGVQAALKSVNRKDLSVSDSQYADLLQGYAMQAQKKHREAVKIYKLIPSSSPYYPYAKLNEGLGYLRQGWWTEAHQEMEKAIASMPASEDDEFKNRLFLVLGYSQLNYEFYRDARNSLRNIKLDSDYANKALMGLGLAAAYQGDYGGALNVFSRLTSGNTKDLSVDEAHLLVPNTYEELGDEESAADTYLKAIAYYKSRIDELNKARFELIRQSDLTAPTVLSSLDARADELYGAKNLIPSYIVNNYHRLLALKLHSGGLNMEKKFETLESEYDDVLKSLVQKNIALREAILNSYLSQAKYGVAKLYDKS